MAQYKVPQDVEADDKLLGPFSFRQFVYLLIAGGLIALAVGLFQLFPMLVIIPVPFALFFLVLALPLKKDQPMETYFAAIVSYYLKPHTRIWEPGQRNTTVEILAPKVVEDTRTRDISGEEATHRLSFLANIVDTEGYAIKGQGVNAINDDLMAEANETADMFETEHFDSLEDTIARDENERHNEVMREMREAITENETLGRGAQPIIEEKERMELQPETTEPWISLPERPAERELGGEPVEKPVENIDSQTLPKSSIIELANNSDYTVATIAKEANRINGKDDDEVVISLH